MLTRVITWVKTHISIKNIIGEQTFREHPYIRLWCLFFFFTLPSIEEFNRNTDTLSFIFFTYFQKEEVELSEEIRQVSAITHYLKLFVVLSCCLTWNGNKAMSMMRGKSPPSDVEMSKTLYFVAVLVLWRPSWIDNGYSISLYSMDQSFFFYQFRYFYDKGNYRYPNCHILPFFH